MLSENNLYLFERDLTNHDPNAMLPRKYQLFSVTFHIPSVSRITGYVIHPNLYFVAVKKNIPVKEYTNERFIDNVIRKN